MPLMCVDKAPDELTTFAVLSEESRVTGPEWTIVFVAGIAGRDGRPPTQGDAEAALQRMVDAIKSGMHGTFIPFDRHGELVLFE